MFFFKNSLCWCPGTTVFAEIQGVVEASVKLSGMPDLTLSFMVGPCVCVCVRVCVCEGVALQKRPHLKPVPMSWLQNPRLLDDVSFHPCVRFKRWESESVLSFIPPDGNFTLMTYHVSAQK